MPPQHMDAKSVLNDIEKHNEYFDKFVDIIPSNVYVVDNSSNNQLPYHKSKHQKSQNKDSKEAKRAKAKAGKLKKFDPAQQESTRDKKKRLEHADDDDDSIGDIQFQDNHEEEQEDSKAPTDSDGCKSNKFKSSPHQSRIEDLKAKLRAKLEERKSNTVTNSTSNTIVSKRAARRADKKRKIEIAKTRQVQQKVSGGFTVTGKNGLVPIKIVKDLGGSKINTETKAKDVIDDLVGIDFGGIAGLKGDLLRGNYSAVNKSLKNKGKKKSLERLLEEAEAKKARLRQLKESDALEDKEKAKKIEWGDALKAASGQKTRKSDPALLKKALKRKAKKKAKSQVAWKSRIEQTKDKMDEKQSIRNHNIKQRAIGGMAGANLSSKRIKDDEDKKAGEAGTGGVGSDKKKRPRLGPHAGRAGFEGKKQDFINKGGGKKDAKSQ